MSNTSHTAWFGDAEHEFDLAKAEIVRELEAATGIGIGGLCLRVIETRVFKHADLASTIRLGLIGGGTDPETAARLVATYLPLRPLAEAQVLAMGILGALWFGSAPTADVAGALAGLDMVR